MRCVGCRRDWNVVGGCLGDYKVQNPNWENCESSRAKSSHERGREFVCDDDAATVSKVGAPPHRRGAVQCSAMRSKSTVGSFRKRPVTTLQVAKTRQDCTKAEWPLRFVPVQLEVEGKRSCLILEREKAPAAQLQAYSPILQVESSWNSDQAVRGERGCTGGGGSNRLEWVQSGTWDRLTSSHA